MEAAAWKGLRDALLRLWPRRDPSPDAAAPPPVQGVATLAPPGPASPVPAPPSLARLSPGQASTSARPRSPGQSSGPAPASPRPGQAHPQPQGEGEEERERSGSGSGAGEGEGEGAEGAEGPEGPEEPLSAGQEQLDTIIRTRGYIVREHLPRRILEHQIMANIRRREKIASILRQGEARAAPRPAPPPAAAHRSQEMLTLLAKVWSGRGASVEERGQGVVEWSRSQFVQECVREHNRLRALHEAPPLLLSDQLCRDAQSWANRLAHFGLMEYKAEHGRGENILTSTVKESMSGTAVAAAWYETGRQYNYEMAGPADLAQAGPFSQVIWAGTRAVGVGVARGAAGRSVVVARYWPPGNVAGEFTTNVQPPEGQPPRSPNPNVVVMSRTRQESHFYVSTALEPPGKNKREPRKRLATFPTAKKLISGGGVTGQTVLGHPTLAATLTSCRNGAVRTSRLLPVCCLAPPRPQQRWAQPSARGRRNAIQESTFALTAGRDDGMGLETARLSPDLPPPDSPICDASPRLAFPWPPSPRLGSPRLPPTPARHSSSPKIIGSSRFAVSPRRGSPKHGSPRRGSPRRGSPRRVVSGRSRRGPGTRVTVLPGVAGAGAGVVASTL